MTKQVLYSYLGTNGTITSPIHLEDIYYTRKIRLTADMHKILTKDNKNFYHQVIISEDEVDNWREVDVPKEEEK